MFITIQPEVYEDIFYHKNIMAAHKIVTHLTLPNLISVRKTAVNQSILVIFGHFKDPYDWHGPCQFAKGQDF